MSEITKQQDSRRIFIDTLIELAEKDDRIVFIVMDVGFNYYEQFQERFPDRFFNFGATEQSSMLIASGMALSGFKPYIFSMINFVTFRVHEMIRNGVAMHNANVKIIGVKGSEKYKFLGFSHNLLYEDEEIEWMQKLMPCYKPKLEEVRDLILTVDKEKKASYIRL